MQRIMTDLISLLKTESAGRSKYFYNIMPIKNIPSVIQHGILSFDKTYSLPHKSIALSSVQDRRDNVHIPNGGRLHSYANLYFTYHNPMLYKRQDEAQDICILAIDQSVLNIEGCVLSDKNAASNMVRFYSPEEGIRNINFDLVFAQNWNDQNPYAKSFKSASKCAEILIPACIPYEYIVGACVVNKENEENLKQLGFDKNITVNPKVFYCKEGGNEYDYKNR